jgi:hypothetical protein
MAGRRIVEMVRADLRMSHIVTRESFENAIVALAAIGGCAGEAQRVVRRGVTARQVDECGDPPAGTGPAHGHPPDAGRL